MPSVLAIDTALGRAGDGGRRRDPRRMQPIVRGANERLPRVAQVVG